MTSYKTFCNLLLKHPRSEVQSPNRAHADVFDKEQVLTLGKTPAFRKSASVIKRDPAATPKSRALLSHGPTTRHGAILSALKSSLLLSSRP